MVEKINHLLKSNMCTESLRERSWCVDLERITLKSVCVSLYKQKAQNWQGMAQEPAEHRENQKRNGTAD